MENTRDRAWRALPFVMAMLLLTLVPLQSAAAAFNRNQAEEAAPGAPIAQNMEIRTYRGVPYTGTLTAMDNEGGELRFALCDAPKKGELILSEDGEFVYTPAKNKAGSDSFTFAATDDEGNVSAPATVKIRIERVSSGVTYSDTDGERCATAAVDLAERGVFVGAKVGDEYFFEPERVVSRGEFVAMAMAAAGIDAADVTVTSFCDDASIPAWAKSYAAGALSAGIVRGVTTEDGVAFRAGAKMTMPEAAAVLNRILKVTNVDLSEVYDGAQGAWYAQAVANLESVSVLQAGRFTGDDLHRGITRAEAAELLSAAMALAESRQTSGGLLAALFK